MRQECKSTEGHVTLNVYESPLIKVSSDQRVSNNESKPEGGGTRIPHFPHLSTSLSPLLYRPLLARKVTYLMASRLFLK